MSRFIKSDPAELDQVCRAILDLSWSDMETLAKTIDSVRRDSKKESRRNLLGQHIDEGVKCIIYPQHAALKKGAKS